MTREFEPAGGSVYSKNSAREMINSEEILCCMRDTCTISITYTMVVLDGEHEVHYIPCGISIRLEIR